MEFETAVKLHIYNTLATTAHAPATFETAAALKAPVARVAEAYESLHRQRLLVPEPGDPSRIRMAPPFSGVPTPFRVRIEERTYHAPCAWDALGIPAALHRDAVVETEDGGEGEPMRLVVEAAGPRPEPCVIHFAVPAARWWEDIVYT
jgi:alkylmercury lyase-like protein